MSAAQSILRFLRVGLWSLAGLLTALLVIVVLLFGSEAGTRLALEQGLRFVPDATVEQIEGSLWSGVTVRGLRYRDSAGTQAELGEAQLAVAWPALLGWRLQIGSLQVTDLTLTLPETTEKPPEPDDAPFDPRALMPDLPIAVQLDELVLTRIRVHPGPGSDSIVLDRLEAAARADRHRLTLPVLDLQLLAPVALSYRAEGALTLDRELTLELVQEGRLVLEDIGRAGWTLESRGPLAALNTSGQGDWQGENTPDARWTLAMQSSLEDLSLESLVVETLDGELAAQGQLDWSEGLDWVLDLALRDLNPGNLAPEVTAPLSAMLHSAGHFDPSTGTLSHQSRLREGQIGLIDVAVTDLNADLNGSETALVLDGLSLSALDGKLDLQGRLDWSAGLAWDGQLELNELRPGSLLPTLDGPLSARLSSQGRLAGELASLEHDTRLDGGRLTVAGVRIEDVQMQALGTLAKTRLENFSARLLQGQVSLSGEGGLDESARWSLQAQVDDIEPVSVVPSLDGPVALRLESTGTYALESGELSHRSRLSDGRLTAGGVAVTDLTLATAGDLASVQIEQLALSLLDGQIDGTAEARWDNGVSWSARLSGAGLDPGLVAEQAAGNLDFDLESRGELGGDGALAHDTQLVYLTGEVASVPLDGLTFRVAGDLQKLRLSELAGRIAGGNLAGEADLTLADSGPAWDGRLSLDRADLEVLRRFDIDPGVSGWLGFDLSSNGQWSEDAPTLKASLDTLRGEIAGQPLSGQARVDLAGETIQISDVAVALGGSRLTADGSLSETLAVDFSLNLPDLAELPAPADLGLAGRLSGAGRVQGDPAAPVIELTLDGQALTARDLAIDRLDFSARVNAEQLDVTGTLESLRAGGQRIDQLQLDGSGTLSAHQVDLEVLAPQGRLTLGVNGGWQAPRWQGQLAQLRLSDTALGDWQSQAPAALLISGASVSLAESCLALVKPPGFLEEQTGPARLCLEAQRAEDGSGSASLTAALPLALSGPWLPPGVELPGTLSLDARGRFGQALQAEIDLSLPDNLVRLARVGEEPLVVDYRAVSAEATLTDDAWRARLGARMPGLLSLDGRAEGGLSADAPLSGRVDLDMPELTWLEGLTPQVTDLVGQVSGQILLDGTLAAPRPSGQFTVRDLALELPETGVAYDDGNLDVQIDANQALTLTGSLAGATDGGNLTITGSGDLSTLPDWQLGVEVAGADLPLMRTRAFSLDASPAVDITADQKGADIRGRVVLPYVEAHVHTLPEGAVTQSPDLVIVGAEEEPPPPYALTTDLEIVLGDRVSLEGMGFSAGLSGQIRLRGDQTAPMAAYGELEIVDGKYAAYGQDLRIDRGRLTFNGPLDDPGLDVRASRKVAGFEAGLELRGTLNHPKSQVYSVPALSESDALSLLLTGRRLSEGTSGADANLLVNALAGLGVAQGDDIARDIGQKVGFDEVGLDTSGGFEDTRLTVGKRLSSRLLIRYAVGVFDGVGTVISEYKINRFLDLEISSSAEAQSGDIIYRIER
ncbi:MAG: translocation/assembly module TamB domain-containing protein [Halothiobacillaceae bacterium]